MISIINCEKFLKEYKLFGPIKSSELYFGNTETYHPQGLYSEEIFGIDGSVDRSKTFSWIELNCNIIHPVLFDVLQKRIFRKIKLLLSGDKTFKIDENGYLIEDEFGNINGMSSLYENIKNIKFQKNIKEEDVDSIDSLITNRSKIVDMIELNIKNDTFFMNKLIVISPNFRPIMTIQDGTKQIDALTELYQKIIQASNQIKNVSGILYNILTYRMQLLIRDLHELLTTRIAKKDGMIRHLMLGRRIDYSARSVITPNPKLSIGQIGLPLRIACQIFEPFLIYNIINSPNSKNIPLEFHKEAKELLAKETYFLVD